MPTPRLPNVTHLQFLMLPVLHRGEQPGRALRAAIAGYGIRRTGAAFYQMMARLERDKLITGWYDQIVIGDQAVTERRYRITTAGSKAWTETRGFYENIG